MVAPFVVLEDTSLEDHGRGDVLVLREEAEHHLRRVRRLGEGDALQVGDGAGRRATAQLRGGGVRLDAAPNYVPAAQPWIRVLQGLPKGKKIDEVVRVLTELGVARITPVETARSVRTLQDDDERRHRQHERWRAISRSACEQARQPHRPVVDPARELDEVLAEPPTSLVAADVGAGRPLASVLGDLAEPDGVTVAVGPEGGWSQEELAAFRAAGGRAARLGTTVLRTEHAATVLVAVLAYELGWYG